MSDPTEEALRAIETKYYPRVVAGEALMPLYPREDVSLMIKAAVAAEREACAKIANNEYDAIDRDLDDYVGKVRHSESWKMACTHIGMMIRARNETSK